VKSGWMVPGIFVHRFEKDLHRFVGKPAVMVNSCTSALHLALIMAGVEEGDEVITTPMSWVSTSNIILYLKAKPVFADVHPDTGLINPEEIKKKITKKTKAIIVVHLYGQLCDMKRIKKVAKKIPIIEDAAHALEVTRVQGFAACFSFHVAKNITCGNGGAIACKNPKRLERLRRHGVVNRKGKRVMLEMGYKYEPTDFQAALLIGQLKRIEKSRIKRKEVYQRYEQAFGGLIKFPARTGAHAYHLFVIWVKNRDKVRAKLLKKGIETSIHYSPIHLEPYYKKLGFKKGSFPIAEKMGREVISLPTYPMSLKQQNYIIKEVIKNV
jgi:dTDP-4-amino-4,6-dideoxygalactose transaminase